MLPVDRWRGHVVDVIVKRDGIDQGRGIWWLGGKGPNEIAPCIEMDFNWTIQIISEERMLPVDRWCGHEVDDSINEGSGIQWSRGQGQPD